MTGTYPAVVSQEDGVALDVSVDHALSVQDRQRLEDGQTHRGDLLLVHPGGPRTRLSVSVSVAPLMDFTEFHGPDVKSGIKTLLLWKNTR